MSGQKPREDCLLTHKEQTLLPPGRAALCKLTRLKPVSSSWVCLTTQNPILVEIREGNADTSGNNKKLIEVAESPNIKKVMRAEPSILDKYPFRGTVGLVLGVSLRAGQGGGGHTAPASLCVSRASRPSHYLPSLSGSRNPVSSFCSFRPEGGGLPCSCLSLTRPHNLSSWIHSSFVGPVVTFP